MGKKLPPEEMELYRRTDEVLHYIWDPIGVSGAPEVRDEYYSYLPRVFSMLSSTVDGKEIVEYLISVERDMMGLSVTDESKDNISEVVDILLSYRDWIKVKTEQKHCEVDPIDWTA
jgi:hypothetical protein